MVMASFSSQSRWHHGINLAKVLEVTLMLMVNMSRYKNGDFKTLVV